jgi:3-oxoacyl-(acyl-carrier-protein) synthase
MTHSRLRRSSLIAQYAVGAALEALGPEAENVKAGSLRLGVIFCAMAGCVNYSRRFYDEVLRDPATASPLIFPETVFNAPASHLAALLGTTAINYTLVGDPGTFLQGLALGADWLLSDRVDGCLVVAAEELDWLVAEAFHLFEQDAIVSDGAGAIYLSRVSNSQVHAELKSVTSPCLFTDGTSRLRAAQRVRGQLDQPNGSKCLLCDGVQGKRASDHDEIAAWEDWPGDRLSPKSICGEALMAASAWQCVTACDLLAQGVYTAATVSIVGTNQQAIAAEFIRSEPGKS